MFDVRRWKKERNTDWMGYGSFLLSAGWSNEWATIRTVCAILIRVCGSNLFRFFIVAMMSDVISPFAGLLPMTSRLRVMRATSTDNSSIDTNGI